MTVASDLTQIERKSLTEEIVDKIVSLIVSGKLNWGDKLPPERELMKRFGVGRSSLREAISSLALIGVLVVKPGSGTHVTISREEFLAKPLSWGIPVGRGRVQELIEARHILEEAIVTLAAQRATPDDLAEIKFHLKQMTSSRKNLRKAINADVQFHTALAKASYNSVLLSFLLQIRHLLRSWMENVLLVPGFFDSAINEHSEILKAVEAHDVERARAALRNHLDSVGQALVSVVSSGVIPKTTGSKGITKA